MNLKELATSHHLSNPVLGSMKERSSSHKYLERNSTRSRCRCNSFRNSALPTVTRKPTFGRSTWPETLDRSRQAVLGSWCSRQDDPRHSHSGPPIFEKLWRARSRLYRSRFLRPRYHFAAFFEIYKMYIPSHRSKLNFYCKISDEILLIFSKKSTFHIKFDVFRIGFDENSSEFQQFSENCEEYSRFHSF